MTPCCYCGGACATGDEVVGPERIVFCLACGVMVQTERDLVPRVTDTYFTPMRIRTRPLTLDELSAQLRDADTMRILCEVEGRRHA